MQRAEDVSGVPALPTVSAVPGVASGVASGVAPAVLLLRPSRLLDVLLLLIGVTALAAAFSSNQPLWLKIFLLVAMGVLLCRSRQHERQRGLRRLAFHDDGTTLTLHFADGRTRRGCYAGYALLGALATFIFIERSGWQRMLGPQRVAVLRDATDADSFRRLRVRLRLGM